MKVSPVNLWIYRHAPGWVASALAFVAAAGPAPGLAAERRGGIEIGAKGVKFSVVELGEKPGDPAGKEVAKGATNTTIAAGVATSNAYNPDAIRDTAEAAGNFAKKMTGELGLPADKIRVFGSSGLPMAGNRQELVDAVKAATNLPAMEFLNPCREVELTIAGLLPAPADRQAAVLVDIGSGNTKGGFLDSGGRPACFSIPQGSVTFADRVTKAAAGKPFPQAAAELRPTLLEAPLLEQVQANPGFAQRPMVFLNGGAPYALATLLHPEAAGEDRVQLSTKDIADYLGRLNATPGVFTPDLSGIADPKVKEAATRDIKNVRDGFTRDNLIAGAEVMAALATALQFEGKQLVFDRTGVTALVRAPFDMVTPPPPPPPPPVPPTPPATPSQDPPAAQVTPAHEPPATPAPPSQDPPTPKLPPVPKKSLPAASTSEVATTAKARS